MVINCFLVWCLGRGGRFLVGVVVLVLLMLLWGGVAWFFWEDAISASIARRASKVCKICRSFSMVMAPGLPSIWAKRAWPRFSAWPRFLFGISLLLFVMI